MDIASILSSGYTQQAALLMPVRQTQEVSGLIEGNSGNSKGDTWSFSAEGMRLSQQMQAQKRQGQPMPDAKQEPQSAFGSDFGSLAAVPGKGAGATGKAGGGAGGKSGGAGGSDQDSGNDTSDRKEEIQSKIASISAQLQQVARSGDTTRMASLESQLAALQSELQQIEAQERAAQLGA